jgi:hypothetical protein
MKRKKEKKGRRKNASGRPMSGRERKQGRSRRETHVLTSEDREGNRGRIRRKTHDLTSEDWEGNHG